ncbi:MAG: hypothetical protein JSS35_00440 [Proteobacteria bacterium]|nr:hypothetical protein [Pseudomonadota bacterium]
MDTRGLTAAAVCGATLFGATMQLAAGPARAQAPSESSASLSHAGNALGLTGADVPPLLAQVKADPYKAPTAPACDTIPVELTQLSSLIGPDLDSGIAAPEQTLTQKGMEAAKGFVPYSGVVRFVTGANKKDKEMREAVLAGYARRGFLRGMQVNLKCGAAAQTAAQAAASDPQPADPPKAPAKKGRAKSTKKG